MSDGLTSIEPAAGAAADPASPRIHNRGGPTDLLWPPEREQLLRDLWETDLTRREIAERLGVSKAAVVGKSERLGLPRRPHVKAPLRPVTTAVQLCGEAIPARRPLWQKWPDEKVEHLRALVAEGKAAREIAEIFGPPATRSSVLGMARRLGLKMGNAQTGRPAKPQKLPRVKKKREKAAPSAPRILAERASPPPAAISEPEPLSSARVSLMELRDGLCRWPIGDPQSENFGFCGARCDVERTYCAHHHGIAYIPSVQRATKANARPRDWRPKSADYAEFFGG